MEISVIIPSFNGAQNLEALLKGLENQNRKDFEVIVVLDGSTDNSYSILNSRDWDVELNIHYQKNKGRAGARNAGAKLASGKYLIFYDDDVIPDSHSIDMHVKGLYSYGITVGKVEDAFINATEFSSFRMRLPSIWLSHLGEDPVLLYPPNLFLTAANMGISRRIFNLLNGFDSDLQDAEDYDLAVRAYYRNIRVLFLPGNIVKNHNTTTCVEYIIRQREYRSAHALLYQKRKNEDKDDLYRKHKPSKSFIKAVFYFFIPGCIAKGVDKGYFRLLPFKLRLSIYPRIISALSIYYPHRKL